MKKLQAILLGAALAGTHPVHALINDGKFGEPGELFVSIYDEAGQQSYYKDLGVNVAQFLAGQGCIPGNLAQDPNYAKFLNKPGLAYNVAAVNPLASDRSNITTWGYLATSSQGASIFNAAWNAIDNTKQKIQAYIGYLNVDAFTNAPGQASQNLSGVFGPSDPGYHGSPIWGATMGHSVAGSTEGALDQPLEFYFVNNSTGDDKGKQVTKLGTWTLSSAGQLSYAGTGTTTICTGTGPGGGGQPPGGGGQPPGGGQPRAVGNSRRWDPTSRSMLPSYGRSSRSKPLLGPVRTSRRKPSSMSSFPRTA